MLSRIREILKRRVDATHVEPHQFIDHIKDMDDVKTALKELSMKVQFFTGCFRGEDDALLMALFSSQEHWHNTSMELSKTLLLLNQRIVDLEKIIREQVKRDLGN